jgi:hypothetical protein
MDAIFGRLQDELDQLGDRIRRGMDSSRLHLERSRLLGIRSRVAYKLGMLYYKKERGVEIVMGELDVLMKRMDDITAKVAKIDRELDDLWGRDAGVGEKPAPDAATAEAEINPS